MTSKLVCIGTHICNLLNLFKEKKKSSCKVAIHIEVEMHACTKQLQCIQIPQSMSMYSVNTKNAQRIDFRLVPATDMDPIPISKRRMRLRDMLAYSQKLL